MTTDAQNDAAGGVVLGTPGREFYKVDSRFVDMTRPPMALRPVQVRALPQSVVFDLRKTAMVIIDMQNEFCSERGWLASIGQDIKGSRALYSPIKRVADHLRRADVPIIWVNWGVRPDRLNLSPGTQHTFNPTGAGSGLGDPCRPPAAPESSAHAVLQKGSWGAAVVDELAPPDGDVQVDKHRISGFWDTPLDSILRNLGVRTLLFAGINTDQCVYATLMDANFHGYDTMLIEDCTATTSPAYCREATLYNVRFAFGFTLTSDDLVEAVRQHGIYPQEHAR